MEICEYNNILPSEIKSTSNLARYPLVNYDIFIRQYFLKRKREGKRARKRFAHTDVSIRNQALAFLPFLRPSNYWRQPRGWMRFHKIFAVDCAGKVEVRQEAQRLDRVSLSIFSHTGTHRRAIFSFVFWTLLLLSALIPFHHHPSTHDTTLLSRIDISYRFLSPSSHSSFDTSFFSFSFFSFSVSIKISSHFRKTSRAPLIFRYFCLLSF